MTKINASIPSPRDLQPAVRRPKTGSPKTVKAKTPGEQVCLGKTPKTSRRPQLRFKTDSFPYPVADPVKMMRVDEVRKEYGLTGKGVTVAVIDSGFNYPGEKPLVWKDFVEGKPEPYDEVGHGTHVAGDIKNIAPGADFIALKTGDIMSDIPSCNIQALQWAMENREKYNLQVINMSVGDKPEIGPLENGKRLSSPPYFFRKYNPVKDAVAKAVEAGLTVVIAAGNSGPRKVTLEEPGDTPQALTVASARHETRVSQFSSRGPALSGETGPDLAAPGEGIPSWAAPGSPMARRSPSPHPGIIINDGTSFSTPLISGVAALMKEADMSLTPGEIKEILKATAVPMDPEFGGPEACGAGFVDAKAAVDEVMKRKKHRTETDHE